MPVQASGRPMLDLQVDISNWMPRVSAKLIPEIESDGRISSVKITSVLGDDSYSVPELKTHIIYPSFHGENVLSFTLDNSFNDYTGGVIQLTLKVAQEAGGGCRVLNVNTSKLAQGMRVFALSPVTRQVLQGVQLQAFEIDGHRQIEKVTLVEVNGRTDELDLGSLPRGRCPN